MTTVSWPATAVPSQFAMVLVPNNRQFRSPYSQALAGVDLLGNPWRFNLSFANQARTDGTLQALFNSLRGAVNNLALWDMNRPAPRGTMRGSPTLAASVAQGASSISLQTTAGATLITGDKIGFQSMLFEVADPATANGSGVATVNLTSRVRKAVSSGVAVVWDKPSTLAVLNGDGIVPVLYGINGADGVQVEFMEAW